MTVFVALLLTAAFVGGVFAAAEGFTRAHVVERVEQRCHEVVGIPMTVTFGPTPLLWQSFARSVGVVQIETAGSPGHHDLRVVLSIDRITGDDSASTLRVLTCSGYVPYPRIIGLIAERELFGSSPHKLLRIRGDARRGTVRVDLSARTGRIAVPVTVTVRPIVDDGELSFAVSKVHTMLFGLPTNFVQGIADELAERLHETVNRYVDIEDITVGDAGFEFTARGEEIVVEANLTRPWRAAS